MLEFLALIAAGAAVLATLFTLVREVLWLFGIDIIYLMRLLLNADLRSDRKLFADLAEQILREELNVVASFLRLSNEVIELPELKVDLRFEAVPAGRFLPPRKVFIQHTRNIPRLRETLRHEVIHYIHYNYIKNVPWSYAEGFALMIEKLLEKKRWVNLSAIPVSSGKLD